MLIWGGELRAFLLYYLGQVQACVSLLMCHWIQFSGILLRPFPYISAVTAQLFSHVWLFMTSGTVAHQAPMSIRFSRQNTGLSCHSLLQGIFPTQESNPGLPHCRQILYHLSHQGSPSIYLCWYKSNCGFSILNFAVWYWNTFLDKCGYVIHHLNDLSCFMFSC